MESSSWRRNSSHPGVRIRATRGTGALGRKDHGHSRVQIKVDALIGGHLTIQGPQWMTRLPEIPAQKLSILKTEQGLGVHHPDISASLKLYRHSLSLG